MQHDEAREFCQTWLAAWTGNQLERLLGFYAEDAFYRDPARPGGLRGHAEMRPYFVKLLAANPTWTWEPLEIFPTERGFSLKWQAAIPQGDRTVVEIGLDIVELADGRITRNEVYFDRLALAATAAR
jgi:SnoaL-like domain